MRLEISELDGSFKTALDSAAWAIHKASSTILGVPDLNLYNTSIRKTQTCSWSQ